MPLEQPELLAKYWYRTGAALRKDATDIQMYGFFPSTWRCLRTWLDEPYESLPTQNNLWFDDFMTFLESVISATFSGREGFLCFLYNSENKYIHEAKMKSIPASPLPSVNPCPNPAPPCSFEQEYTEPNPKWAASPSFSRHLHLHQLLMHLSK